MCCPILVSVMGTMGGLSHTLSWRKNPGAWLLLFAAAASTLFTDKCLLSAAAAADVAAAAAAAAGAGTGTAALPFLSPCLTPEEKTAQGVAVVRSGRGGVRERKTIGCLS